MAKPFAFSATGLISIVVLAFAAQGFAAREGDGGPGAAVYAKSCGRVPRQTAPCISGKRRGNVLLAFSAESFERAARLPGGQMCFPEWMAAQKQGNPRSQNRDLIA